MRRRAVVALAAIALLLVAARALLPNVLQRYVNRVLDESPAYEGSVGDIDVALWRGAYTIDGVEIRKRGERVPVPLFAGERVDLSIEWRALFDGALVGEIVLEHPQLHFVAGPPGARQTGAEQDWRDTVGRLFPMTINRVEVRNGEVHFRNFHSEPKVDVYLRRIGGVAHNLTNSLDLAEDRVAEVTLSGVAMNTGQLSTHARFDPFAELPDFDFDGTVKEGDLTQWNDFLRAYLGVDVQRGTFSIYSELLAKDGRFEGYIKPFFEDVDVLRLTEEGTRQGPLASLWEAVVGATGEVFEDQGEDRIATRIPISGTVRDPRLGFWPALGQAVRNAFIEGLPARLEASVGEE